MILRWSGKSTRSTGRQKKGQKKDNSHFYSGPEFNTAGRSPIKRIRKRQQLALLSWSGKSTRLTGRQKRARKDNNWRFHADPESQHGWRVAKKKDKKKATTCAFTLIRKVNMVDRSPKIMTRKRPQLTLLRWSGKSTRSTGHQKKGQEKDNSHFYAGLKSQHGQRVPKKRIRKRQQLAVLRWSRKSTRSTGRPKKRTRKRQLPLLNWSIRSKRPTSHQKKKGLEKGNSSRFFADPQSQRVRWVAKKKGKKRLQLALLRWSRKSPRSTGHQKKGKKKATTPTFTLVRKVNTVDGSPKKGQERDNNSRFYAGPESQHDQWVAKKKKGQEKDNDTRFYTGRSGLEIRSSTALKFLMIVERMANDSWTGPETTALSRSLKVRPKTCQRSAKQESWAILVLLYLINKLILKKQEDQLPEETVRLLSLISYL